MTGISHFFEDGKMLKIITLDLATFKLTKPPIDLYSNFEKSSWQNRFRQTGFLACKNQFRNGFLLAKNPVRGT